MTDLRADYAPTCAPGGRGGSVASVETNSPAERGGVVVGDVVLTADGVELLDVIDWHWFADEDTVELEVVSQDGTVRDVLLERESGESWGIGFSSALFDDVHVCKNACTFCFMSMLPKGMRSPLYLRDDDYRLSFLQGNFVTLTNLAAADVARIIEQHLAPLHVSVHAWNDDVRRSLIGRNHARGKAALVTLLEAGIDVHAQVVLVPDANDGAVLLDTLEALLAYDGVRSVGVVPLGFTKFQTRYEKSFDAAQDAARVIDDVEEWLAGRPSSDAPRVQLADEFYLSAGRALPSAESYGGFPQYEDGIGMVRSFIDDAYAGSDDLRSAVAALSSSARAVFVTGRYFAPVLDRVLGDVADSVGVLAVDNRYFGGNVGVAGLLTAEDVLREVAEADPRATVFLPSVMLNADGLTLDGWDLARMRAESGRDLRVVSCSFDGVLSALASLS